MILTRELRIAPVAAEIAADALIPVTIATDYPVMRYDVVEVLDCSPAGVDLTRAPLSLIIGHDGSQLAIGVIEDLRADGTKVTGMARFGSSPEAQQVRADVVGGIHPYVSVGYSLLDQGTPIEGGFKFRWQPHEVSIVSVPADPAAGFFRSLNGVSSMPTPELQTRDTINALCARHGLTDLARTLNDRKVSVDVARAEVLDELARRDFATGSHLNVRRGGDGGDAAAECERIINTLVSRMGGKAKGDTIGSTDCVGLAARALKLAGQQVSDRDSRDAILQRALNTRSGGMLSTSDFPSLLGTAVGRVLHQAYDEAPAALKSIARLNNLPDFRAKTSARLGPASALEKVNEHGEFKYGTVQDSGNTWQLFTYGKIIAITRQALINDDLGGFAQLMVKFGQSAARREADELVSMLTNPPNVDGAALFSAGRNTLITGGTSVLAAAGIGLAVKALRAQQDLGGGFINHEPAALVVPAALEMTARQLVASITPAQASNVQPYSLSVAVEPRLDAVSATAWYLAAGNQSALEYGYLDGAEGVQTSQREGFEIDGMEIKARLDFGCGWVSPVGWVKSAGA